MGGRTLLRAGLHDPIVSPCGLDHRPAFRHVVSQGLFDVHVLPRLTGEHGGNRMPVVGRGDQQRVDVVAVEHAAEVAVRRDVWAEPRLRPLGLRQVNVADGHNLDVGRLAEASSDKRPSPAAPDPADADPLVGPGRSFSGSGLHDRRSGDTGGQKISSFHGPSSG